MRVSRRRVLAFRRGYQRAADAELERKRTLADIAPGDDLPMSASPTLLSSFSMRSSVSVWRSSTISLRSAMTRSISRAISARLILKTVVRSYWHLLPAILALAYPWYLARFYEAAAVHQTIAALAAFASSSPFP